MISETVSLLTKIESLWAILGTIVGAFLILYRKLLKIYKQVIPNGGLSLADTINQIRENQQIGQVRTQLLWEHTQEGLGYYECEPESGECSYANKYLCDLFGLSLEQFLGFGWMASIENQKERDRIHKSWLAAVRDDIPYQEEYNIRTSQELKRVRTRAWAARDKKTGKVLKMFGTLEEIKND